MPKASTTPKVRYNLKEYIDKDGEQQIVVVFRYPQKDAKAPRLRLLYHTGLKVNPKYWDNDKSEAKESVRYENGSKINKKLDSIKTLVLDIHENNKYITLQEFRNELDYSRGRKDRPVIADPNKKSFEEFILHEIEKQKIKVNGKKGGQTWQKYSSLLKRIKDFAVKENWNLSYDSINESFKDDYVLWLEKKRLSQNTISKDIETIKTLLKRSRRFHSNTYYTDDDFKVSRVSTSEHYPTLEELKHLFQFAFENETHQKVIDLYLISAFGGGLRISDVLQLDIENETDLDGAKVLHVYTYKGREVKEDNEVVIPFTPQLRVLIDKYQWKLPRFSEQYINDTLKDAFEIAELTRTKLMKSGVKGEDAKLRRLCDVVHFHTARFSYIDYMMNDLDVSAEQLKKITGQSLKVLLAYERGDKKKNAVKVAEIINKRLIGLKVV